MEIRKLTARNFYSFKHLELDLTKYNGIVRIEGKNKDSEGSNGSGKSSIFEAIVFGIFGKTIRKSTEESIVNNSSGRDTMVVVELIKGNERISIHRTKRPSSLNLFVNDQNRNKETALETQKLIEELLETDYKSFLASVVFGQHSEVSFLDSSPEEKRNIIKNCFSLEEFFLRRTAIKELKSKYTSELKVWNTILDSLRKEKLKLEANIPDKKYKYVELPSLESILQAEKKILEVESQIHDNTREIRKINDSLKKVKEAIKRGPYKEQNINDILTLTNQEMQLRSELEILEHNEVVFYKQIVSLTPEYSSSLWAKYNEKNKLVLEANQHIDKFNQVLDQIKEHETKIKELDQKCEVMKFWEMAFSEKGIIKYIIRNILEYFNNKSNEYVSILTNNQFTITFSDELAETIRNNGTEVKYISLSGGEKRKANLAIMLALQDLSSKISKTDCNLIFFDEICDNIDDLGIEAIHNLLNTLNIQYPDKKLFIITHNNYLSELLNESQEIKVIKEKGISRI
jgi:DNA repair exonuclease SbcCD ATPase subunit